MRQTVEERFWSKVEKGPSCWEWMAGKSSGYGKFRLNGVKKRAHRLSWEWKNGEIPEGLVIDHLCRNSGCVNPSHMEAVTQLENVRRGFGICAINARKTHCKQGHEFTKENIYVRKFGGRNCKKCVLESGRIIRLKKKQERVQ